jgi:hypothetical protein
MPVDFKINICYHPMITKRDVALHKEKNRIVPEVKATEFKVEFDIAA